jgi:alkylation response protein AidB-like acyl-CoA dehydrogenase
MKWRSTRRQSTNAKTNGNDMETTMNYENDVELNEQQKLFIAERINAKAAARDATGEAIPREDLRFAAGLGMSDLALPSPLGGKETSRLKWGMFLEALGAHCTDNAFPLITSLRAGLVKTLYEANNPWVNDTIIPDMVAGKSFPSFAFTDGTDPFSFQTIATPVDDGYIVSGEKQYVTGASSADYFMTYARDSNSTINDLKVLLIHKDDPGVTVVPVDLAGLRTAGISRLVLDEVHVPQRLVLASSDGLSHVQEFLNERRVFLVCPLLGRMQALFDSCIGELTEKIRYRSPLTEMQYVQARIGKMRWLIESARAALYRSLHRMDQGSYDQHWDVAGAVSKLSIIENAIEVVHICQKLVGGDGYLRDKPYERCLRDFCGYLPGGGSQETLLVDLGIRSVAQYELSQRISNLGAEKHHSASLS